MSESSILSVLKENSQFLPPTNFQENALINSKETYLKLWHEAKDHPEKFWGNQARQLLSWIKPFTQVKSNARWDSKWFEDGKLNACFNAVDRHLPEHANKPAIIWQGEPDEKRILTFKELHANVCRLANALLSLGVQKGDVVTIYMPMVPELAEALLACARIGAIHSVIFAGFSPESIAGRIKDTNSQVLLTADGGFRRGQTLPLKTNIDKALALAPQIKQVLVLKRTNTPIDWVGGRDLWWHELVDSQSLHCPWQECASEDPLFILYTSGSTGKPKGILHTTAGYLLGSALSFKYIFDIKPDDIYWCTADVGWITGHSYIIYGPLLNATTILMYEGAPNYPDWGRFWKIIETFKVTKFYTAPTAIRSFMQQGHEWPQRYDLSSLKLLGTVGEPINPRAWMWYHEHIGRKNCPIVDTWWQTETGSIMISPLPGACPTKSGSACLPFFGAVPLIVDFKGNPQPPNTGGFLVLTQPWPSMFRSIWNDHKRYEDQYFKPIANYYLTGDGARVDHDGYFWIMGRIDDVINVAGHRLSTMEIESALVSHKKIAEAAVVGKPDEIKGEAISCFVVLKESYNNANTHDLTKELSEHIVSSIGGVAKPSEIRFTTHLPKTRSGKIMRRLLRDIAAGRDIAGDISTLEDITALEKLRLD